jgi:hypothetical protein
MIADWKTFDTAPKQLLDGEFVGRRILICDRWNDVFCGCWSEDLNSTPAKPGWHDDVGALLGPDMSDFRWDDLPDGYIAGFRSS